MNRLTSLGLLAVLLGGGCKIRNELSCDIPNNCATTDGGESCANDEECTTGVCKLPAGVCVPCLDDGDCQAGSTQPICNTSTNACEACTANAQCPTEACDVATGACFATVAYVEAGATGNCDQGSPCGSIQEAFDTGRPVIKVQGSVPVIGTSKTTIDRSVTIVGDAGLTPSILRTMSGPTFEVQNGATLTLRDLELSGNTTDALRLQSTASATLDHVLVIDNTGFGILAMQSQLTLSGCVISRNDNGGLALSDSGFDITNTIIAGNGTNVSTIGGMRSVGTVLPVVFEFNTIADNQTNSTNAVKAGVDCAGTAFPAHNNIVDGLANTLVLDPTCTFDHSLFTGVAPLGEGNLNTGDVRFLDAVADHEHLPDFYRLAPNSDAIGLAAASAIEIDIDGQARPQGDAKDAGADEVMQ